MNGSESFSYLLYADQKQLAERELSAFIGAVKRLFGPEQARVSAEDWLREAELLDSPPRWNEQAWRSITIAASARLAARIDAAQHPRKSLTDPSDAKISPILSSNCSGSTLLF